MCGVLENFIKGAAAFLPLIFFAGITLRHLWQGPDPEFDSWSKKPRGHESPRAVPSLDDFLRKGTPAARPADQKNIDIYVEAILEAIRKRKVPNVYLSTGLDQRFEEFTLAGPSKTLTENDIGNVEVANMRRDINFEKLAIRNVTLQRMTDNVTLKLCDCYVGTLRIHGHHEGRPPTIQVRNTWIENLEIFPKCCKSFDMDGGGFLNLECPVPTEANPFLGPVSLRNIFVPRRSGPGGIQTAQPMRSLRAHLMDLGNIQAASVIHSAELALDRKDETDWNKFISYFYEISSDFGAATFRPLGLLLSLFFATFLLGGLFEAVELQVDPSALVGWQEILGADGRSGDSARAALLAVQPIVNPLGIFGVKALVVAKNIWMAGWILVQGIISPILIAMFIFALRRRFKMGA